MEGKKSILHELYVYSEWKPEPEYLQKPDNILPENISALWKWLKFFGPKKSLIDSVTAHKEKQQKWHLALGDEGKVIAVLTDNILEIRTKRSEYATIAARTTVSRDSYAQWRKLVWSPDCSFVVLCYGNGIVSFFDLTASNLFNIPIDCSRPGGLECTDNTHAVADIIFMPLRVKDNKWNWEVLVVTYDGKLRGYLVSQTDEFKLHHTFRFPGGVAAIVYCESHSTLYVAGLPRAAGKDQMSPLTAGITAWRILNDDPFYKLSVVSDELEAQLANERFQLYIPFISSKNMAFIVRMELSPDNSKLVCLHCNGDISVWRLPLLKAEQRWSLDSQPEHDLHNPLIEEKPGKKDLTKYYAADVNWWSNEEIIISRFSGAVSICNIVDMINILGNKPEFFQGSPQVTCSYDGTFMVLECESNVLPAKKSRSDESMEVVKVENDVDDTMLELTKELFKTILYAITDMETFQPKPKRITVVSRVYRLLGVKSTTPSDLFSRKIESGNYAEALTLADTFGLDSDLVYQQQWRKNPVSTETIDKYLSKVSKEMWAVHQCMDRLPETLPAAKELLQFGLDLTNEKILNEINKEAEHEILYPEDITLEQLNAYTSELLRCRHVMLFYKERLALYESILKSEKSTYVKDEYDRLRSNSIVHSAMEIAKEGRVEALTCLWPHLTTKRMQLAVLDKLPETMNPIDYQHLLPTPLPEQCLKEKSPAKTTPSLHENDWCRKPIFRSIWSSNWSEESTPEAESSSEIPLGSADITQWYEKRAREIEERSGMASHALTLLTIATNYEIQDLDRVMFHLTTLNTLIYDVNIEDVSLKDLEKMTTLEVCRQLMKMSTPETFVSDLNVILLPFLKRHSVMIKDSTARVRCLFAYLESISVEDLSSVICVLESPRSFNLSGRTHLELVERCLFAQTTVDQLDKACDLLNTILNKSDESISKAELVRRANELELLVAASERLAWRDLPVTPRELRDMQQSNAQVHKLLTRLARSHALSGEKPTQYDWEVLFKDILELQSTVFTSFPKSQCYEIYLSALLTSGVASTIRLAGEVLTCEVNGRRSVNMISYSRSVYLVSSAAREYVNSASSLDDPALDLARCCLSLIRDENRVIRSELDLIAALSILNSFNLQIIPIQVRLCEHPMMLIEECLKLDPSAYLAGHKLLKLARLLRISMDDDREREGMVLRLVCEYALRAGSAGASTALETARALSELRYRPAAPLLARVADRSHADAACRRGLYAAALVACNAADMAQILRARLSLGLEHLQQTGLAMKESLRVAERCPSTDEEFADAITTPVIEKKDLVAPQKPEKKMPFFNLLLESFQNKFSASEAKPGPDEPDESGERRLHCQEFYASLYPEQRVSPHHYRYERFALPDAIDCGAPSVFSLLACYYAQNCLDGGQTAQIETEVACKCGLELVHADTALGVSSLSRACCQPGACARALPAALAGPALCCLLYAVLLRCNVPRLKNDVYLAKPSQMARNTLKQQNASEEQLQLIKECVDRLTGISEVAAIRALGLSVNGLMFHADADYRREVIYRLARSSDKVQTELACSLAHKYGLDALDVWLQHAAAALALDQIKPDSIPVTDPNDAHKRIKEALWDDIVGTDHNALINYFTLLKAVDEKPLVFGATAADHIKLLKKAKASSADLDYKLLVEQPSAERYLDHLLDILKPETVGMVTKFLRTLPPAFKPPAPLNTVYTRWLTKYFFSVPAATASNKKWMQQYRQCASFFNKLSKDDLLRFVEETCFSNDAVQRVPAGTRNLMIMQAVDYCQQEQEDNCKFNKNDQSWTHVGQELTRWARFLENYHSTTIQNLIDHGNEPQHEIWQEIERSHGDSAVLVPCLGRLVAAGELRAGGLVTLLQCLHVAAAPPDVFAHVAATSLDTAHDVQTLVSRLMQYNKEGVKFPEELIEKVLQRASEVGVPPHKQIGLLSMSARGQLQQTDDLQQIATFSVDLFRTEWPDLDYSDNLTDNQLLSEEGRREVFYKYLEHSKSWQKKKALVDVLNCWPAVRTGDTKSLHSEFIYSLITGERRQGHGDGDQAEDKEEENKENLVLIKLLLRRPVLSEEELMWLAQSARSDAVFTAVWVALLSRFESSNDVIIDLLMTNKEAVRQMSVDDELIKELLDNDLFIKLVPTPIFQNVLSYIIQTDAKSGEPVSVYTVKWAIDNLIKANYLAEAGRLRLTSLSIPASLQGFSQSIMYCKGLLRYN